MATTLPAWMQRRDRACPRLPLRAIRGERAGRGGLRAAGAEPLRVEDIEMKTADLFIVGTLGGGIAALLTGHLVFSPVMVGM